MSTRPSVSPRPAACSGAMYSGVPNTEPARVNRGSAALPGIGATLAIPKSTIFTKSVRPSRSTRKMFSGLRSRWTMPLSCAAPSAREIWAAILIARSGGNGAPWRIAAPSVWPSTNSITEYVMPSGVVPKSVTSTMFGWPIRDAAFASWTNLRIVAVSRITSRLSTLIASGRSITAWRAENTTPIPPSPIFFST